MSIPNKEPVQAFCAFEVENLTLWQTFLFFLWNFNVLASKFAYFFAEVFEQWFLASVGYEGGQTSRETSPECNLASGSA